MASKSTSFYMSDGALAKLDQMVIDQRRADGTDSSRSSVVEMLINAAAAQPQKRIEAVYEPGKRGSSRLIGWAAYYGSHLVGSFDGAGSKPQAEKALDAYVYEELSR